MVGQPGPTTATWRALDAVRDRHHLVLRPVHDEDREHRSAFHLAAIYPFTAARRPGCPPGSPSFPCSMCPARPRPPASDQYLPSRVLGQVGTRSVKKRPAHVDIARLHGPYKRSQCAAEREALRACAEGPEHRPADLVLLGRDPRRPARRTQGPARRRRTARFLPGSSIPPGHAHRGDDLALGQQRGAGQRVQGCRATSWEMAEHLSMRAIPADAGRGRPADRGCTSWRKLARRRFRCRQCPR